ncbi:MAG: HEAT repeat domain-containing protein, partial [Verrucomicrobia bacterium]|nr:HEAT repeat domain-containing protein [Verrucomicrobiota bacterium]
MSKRSKIIGLALAALVLGLLAVVGSWSREPSYRGRSLTSWLKQCSQQGFVEPARQAEAEAAIREIGAERALPHLLRMAQAHDGQIRKWLIEKIKRWDIAILTMREAEMTRQFAIDGFRVLGTNCAAAVPQLTRLIGDTNYAYTALVCLAGIGKAAEMPVCQALTNRDPLIRWFATRELNCVMDDEGVYMARLKGPLNDPDAMVRCSAIRALGLQTNYLNEVIALLIKAMQDPQPKVSRQAVGAVGSFGTNGMKAFDALSDVVANGDAITAAEALRSMILIEPQRALPIALSWLQSGGANEAMRAGRILDAVNTTTPEIVSALRGALADPSPFITHAVTTTLIRLRQKARAAGTAGPVIIAGEPSYGGKSLLEWLQTRDRDGLTLLARDAVRQMGTNAIPALLQMLTYRDPE